MDFLLDQISVLLLLFLLAISHFSLDSAYLILDVMLDTIRLFCDRVVHFEARVGHYLITNLLECLIGGLLDYKYQLLVVSMLKVFQAGL